MLNKWTPLTNFLSLQWVPDVAVEVVVAGKDKAAWAGESQRRDAGVQAGVLVSNHLLVGAQVVHLAGAVVGACDDGISTGEELRRAEKKKRMVCVYMYVWWWFKERWSNTQPSSQLFL